MLCCVDYLRTNSFHLIIFIKFCRLTITKPNEYGIEEEVIELCPGKCFVLHPSKCISFYRQVRAIHHSNVTSFCSIPAPAEAYAKEGVFVPPVLAKWLRPHQREGVQFMYECVMGLKGFSGAGCILADDMGLGKVCVVFFFVVGLHCFRDNMYPSTRVTFFTSLSLSNNAMLHTRPFNPSR